MFTFLFKEVLRGNSIARAMMNYFVRDITLKGVVVDIGGGRGASYLAYMKKADGVSIAGFDLKVGKGVEEQIDFETDRLPRGDNSVDQVLMFNILEHIYHHQYLLSEGARILKRGGEIIGFVPFLVNYHPDPHDYFRYTREALVLLLSEAGFVNVRVVEVGRGPLFVNLNNIISSLPRAVNIFITPFYYFFDSVLLFLRPAMKIRYPLGYLFQAEK